MKEEKKKKKILVHTWKGFMWPEVSDPSYFRTKVGHLSWHKMDWQTHDKHGNNIEYEKFIAHWTESRPWTWNKYESYIKKETEVYEGIIFFVVTKILINKKKCY